MKFLLLIRVSHPKCNVNTKCNVQVHNEEGVNYSAYMRRIKSLVLEGLGDTKDQVRVLAVEVNWSTSLVRTVRASAARRGW